MTATENEDRRIVYSSEHGRMCPGCGNPASRCTCRRRQAPAPGDGVVRVARSTRGRKGKVVTVVTGLPLDAGGLQKLARELKQRCGSGGTVKDGVIEVQGDHGDLLFKELEERGYRVKR